MPRPRLIAWARPDQEALLREAIDVADLELIAVGSDEREGAAELARAFEVERLGELRAAIRHPDVDLLLLATPAPVEAAERGFIRERKLRTLSLEPRPGQLNALVKEADEADTAEVVPLFRCSDGFRAAQQLLGELAPPHSLYLSFRSRPEQGTLFARLFDVMDFVDQLCGDVDTIGASLADPDYDPAGTAHHVAESLPRLRGHMSINFHFAENRCAAAVISSVSDAWFRGATLLAGEGCLRITDRECHWSGEPGEAAGVRNEAPVTAGRLLGEAILRRVDDLDRDVPPPNFMRLLALCEAARLSCRTGQAESPSRMLAMMSHV